MPVWAEIIQTPRTLAVEFPFGQILGQPHAAEQQRSVILQALQVLETSSTPGEIVHSPEIWPQPVSQAVKEWQPSSPSPMVQELAPKIRQLLRKQKGD